MYGYYTLLLFLTTCFWVLTQTQGDAFFYDVLDPPTKEDEDWLVRDPRVAMRSGFDRELGCEKPSLYLCEEHPNTIPVETTKTCDYRNNRYHEQVFRWVAGTGCLFYTHPHLYVAGHNTINLRASCVYQGLFAPCLEIAKSDGTCGCFPFDPAFEEVANAVREHILPAGHGRWERCFYTASDCCSHHMSDNYTASNRCETTFDGWTCWDEAEADTVATSVCPEFAYTNSGPSCHHYATKFCYDNGTWDADTDVSTCSVTPRLRRRYRFHIAVLSFSIASCLPAVFIFFFYKRLRVTRVMLHRNLMIAIITRNVLVIVSRAAIYIPELTNNDVNNTVMSNHGIACRLLAIAERIAANGVFVAMLVEGLYLHRTIVAVFRKKLSIVWLYGIGAVIAVTPIVAWSVVMGVMNDHSCWLVYTVDGIQWILDAPRIAILLINTALFIDVLRVLLTKIRNSENANQLSTAKATLFLMPIFGTQFLLTALRPSTTDCTVEQIYYYVAYTVEGLQGFIVALLYCYVNKEVHDLIKATYKKTENAIVSRIRNDSNYHRPSNSTDKRLTCTTGLPSNQDDKEYGTQYSGTKPKLHVAEIISIQASERLAEILEPVYETIQHGVINEGYDSLDRSENGSCLQNKHPKDDYYAFTNASSVSIDCQDWIRCVSSPSSSVYNNSLNDYETRYLEKKFPKHPRFKEINESRIRKPKEEKQALESCESSTEQNSAANKTIRAISADSKIEEVNKIKTTENNITPTDDLKGAAALPKKIDDLDPDIEDNEMLDEIMQYIEQSEIKPVGLNPELLSPNRTAEDKLVFVEE